MYQSIIVYLLSWQSMVSGWKLQGVTTISFCPISDEGFDCRLGGIWIFGGLPVSSALIGLGGWLWHPTMFSETLLIVSFLVNTGVTGIGTTSLDN